MKYYLIREEDIEALRNEVKLEHFETKESMMLEKTPNQILSDFHKRYIYRLESWIGRIKS